MCSVSAVSDYYMNKWPYQMGTPNPFQSVPGLGTPLTSPPAVDLETKEMMRKVLQLLDRIDKRLGDIECMDTEKAAFLKSLDLDPTNIGG